MAVVQTNECDEIRLWYFDEKWIRVGKNLQGKLTVHSNAPDFRERG